MQGVMATPPPSALPQPRLGSGFSPTNMDVDDASPFVLHRLPPTPLPPTPLPPNPLPPAPNAPLTLEEEYAAIAARLLLDEGHARDAVAGLESMCTRRATQLALDARQAVHRPARYMHLQNLSQEFQAQAATWHLVWCLHCDEQPPGGSGGPIVADTGNARTARQILADAILGSPALTRCAAVVSWLESLADDALGAEGDGAPQFATHEGVWLESMRRAGQGGMVSELDPDAPTRQHIALHPDNAAAEERLLARCWQLVRAGRHRAAQELWRVCGQPWRAASFGGASGQWGPLPVGLAAVAVEESLSPEAQAEELGSEVEAGGPAAPRALWRWTCLQAASAASAAGGRHEAALYGLLAGHLPSVLPVCGSWQDWVWAHCRTWLEGACDAALAVEHGAARAGGGAAAWQHMPLDGDDVIVDVIARFSGQPGKARSALAGAAAAGVGQLPVVATGAASGALDSFDAIFAAARQQPGGVGTTAQEPLCHVQQLLVQDATSELVGFLYTWLGATRAAVRDPASAALPGAADEAGLGLPARPARMVAFGCHLALVLGALGVLQSATHGSEGALAATRISGLNEQILALHVAELMDRGCYQPVPQYLCHMRESLRGAMSYEVLAGLSKQLVAAGNGSSRPAAAVVNSPPDGMCAAVHAAMAGWFGRCIARQAAEQAAGDPAGLPPNQAPSNFLRTSIRADEARILIGGFWESVRLASLTTSQQPGGAADGEGDGVPLAPAAVINSRLGEAPLSRANVARWLFYGLGQLSKESNRRSSSVTPPVPTPPNPRAAAAPWVDALEAVVDLVVDLVVGDDAAAEAAAHLLTCIIPQDFVQGAEEALEALQGAQAELRARAAALGAEGDQAGADGCVAAADELRATAARMRGRLDELVDWAAYTRLERQATAWQARFAAHKTDGAGPAGDSARTALLGEGQQLLGELMDTMLVPEWMEGVAQRLDGGEFAAKPQPLGITLVVTEPRETGGETAAQPFPVLKGAALASFAQRLQGALEAAAPALGVATTLTPPPGAQGHVTVQLKAQPPPGAPAPAAAAARAVWELGWALLAGSLPGAPPLLAVNLVGPRALTLPLAQRCAIAKAVRLCADLRLAVAVLGGDGTDGAALTELLVLSGPGGGVAGGEPGHRFSALLSPAQLAEVLQLEAETAVQLLANAQRQWA